VVRRICGSPRKTGASVIHPDSPWERDRLTARHALLFDADDDVFKLWYNSRVSDGDATAHYLCYAESADGMTWSKPTLGLHEFAGKRNNSILHRVSDANGPMWNVVKNRNNPDPAKRYKALGFEYCVDSDASPDYAA